MKRLLGMSVLALAACSPAKQQPDAQASASSPAPSPTSTFTPPKTKAGALLAKYAGATGPYAPRDECAGLDGAEDFRIALADAVVKRDDDALIRLADPHVRLDFGHGYGADLLRKRLDSPIYKLWGEFAAILPLGCATQGKDSLTLPWFFAQDFGKRDSFRIMLVEGDDVPLLASPDKAAAVVAKLSWDGVELAQGETSAAKGPFAHVTSFGGKTGYVARDKLRALTAYRLLANKTDDGWRITGLIAGD
jgi:hypothetical protein